MVRATGNAKRDQSLYLGTYSKISDYNGHSAYELDGKGQLYIYYYSSPVSQVVHIGTRMVMSVISPTVQGGEE